VVSIAKQGSTFRNCERRLCKAGRTLAYLEYTPSLVLGTKGRYITRNLGDTQVRKCPKYDLKLDSTGKENVFGLLLDEMVCK
jgi:hypothetical protein